MSRPADPHAKIDLLRAAEAVFVEHGLDHAKVEDITARAGRSKGAFYLHFESKEDASGRSSSAAGAPGRLPRRRRGARVRARGSSARPRYLARWQRKDLEIFEFCWQNRGVMRLLLEGGGSAYFGYLIDEFAERSARADEAGAALAACRTASTAPISTWMLASLVIVGRLRPRGARAGAQRPQARPARGSSARCSGCCCRARLASAPALTADLDSPVNDPAGADGADAIRARRASKRARADEPTEASRTRRLDEGELPSRAAVRAIAARGAARARRRAGAVRCGLRIRARSRARATALATERAAGGAGGRTGHDGDARRPRATVDGAAATLAARRSRSTARCSPVHEADLGFKCRRRLARDPRASSAIACARATCSRRSTPPRRRRRRKAAEAQVRAAEAQLGARRGRGAAHLRARRQRRGVARDGRAGRRSSARSRAAQLDARARAARPRRGRAEEPHAGRAVLRPRHQGADRRGRDRRPRQAALPRRRTPSTLKLAATVGEGDAPLVEVGAAVARRASTARTVAGSVTVVAAVGRREPRAACPSRPRSPNDRRRRCSAGVLRARERRAAVDADRRCCGCPRPRSAPARRTRSWWSRDGKLARAPRRLRRAADGALLVRAGLDAGDDVLLAPSAEAHDGDDVPRRSGDLGSRADEPLRDRHQAPGLHRHGDGGAPGARRASGSRALGTDLFPDVSFPVVVGEHRLPGREPRARSRTWSPSRSRTRSSRSTASTACAPTRARGSRRRSSSSSSASTSRRRPRRCASASRRSRFKLPAEVEGAGGHPLRRRGDAGPHLHAARAGLALARSRKFAEDVLKPGARAGRRRRRRRRQGRRRRARSTSTSIARASTRSGSRRAAIVGAPARRPTSPCPPATTTRARARSACAPSASSARVEAIRDVIVATAQGRLGGAPARRRHRRGRLRGAAHAHPRQRRGGGRRSRCVKQSGRNTVAVADAVKARLARAREDLPRRACAPRSSSTSRAFIRENAHEVEIAIVFGGAMAILIILIFMLDLRSTHHQRRRAADQRHRHVLRHVRARLHAEHDDAARPVAGDRPAHRRRGRRAREHLQAPRARRAPARGGARRHRRRSRSASSPPRSPSSPSSCPVAFMSGIVGQFFRQFGLTVSAAVLISLFVAFTLDPMLSSRFSKTDRPRRSATRFAWHQAALRGRLRGDGRRLPRRPRLGACATSSSSARSPSARSSASG